MPMEQIFALVGFVAVMTGTPGPNNLMLVSSGANAGFIRSLPHILGIVIGCQIMLLCIALGLGQLLSHSPSLINGLRITGALYLLWLAWQLVRNRSLQDHPQQQQPLTFIQAALFQWVNPKAWMMTLTGVATFTQPHNFTPSMLLLAGTFVVVGLPLISSWNLFGAALKNGLKKGKHLRYFNRVMAVLLVASLYPTFGIQPSQASEVQPSSSPAPQPELKRDKLEWWMSVM